MPVAKPSRMTNPVTVKSSSLVQVAYDSQRAILQVAFRDGTAYRYDGVPLRVYHGLLQAESKGAYFQSLHPKLISAQALHDAKPAESGRPSV